MTLGARPFATVLVAAALLAPPARGASFPPELHFRAVSTDRIVVY